jgi:hypothetical protein
VRTVDLETHKRRVKALRKAGYRVKTIRLEDGSLVVLRSKRPFNCTAHHQCTPLKKQPRRGW